MKKKIFTLLALLVCAVGSAWADDVVSATQTFTNSRKTCTWDPISATVAKGNTAGSDGLYFTAKSDKAISTSSSTVQGGNGAISVVYVQVVSASSSGTITMTSSTDASDRPMYLESYNAQTNAEAKVVCAKNGSTANFTSSDVVSYAGGYYVKLSNTDNKDVKIKSFAITLTSNESYPEIVKEDPVFSLTKTSITTAQTSQIQVGTKGSLDGIELSDITYGTAGVVTVDADGVVTPVAAGTTTIKFNSSASSKYYASTDNSLTITVTEAITVFDADGLYNQEIILSQANIEDKDYLTCNATNWQDKGWSSPHDGNFLDWKTGRKITLKVKNAYAFELYVSGTKDRTYKIKVGTADAVEYTQGGNGSGFVSSGVIATGTTDEVTIEIEGGSNTLYPVYFIINPAVELTEEATNYTPVAATDATVSLIRTLSASYYNTFCVPFDIDLTDENSPLYGADVQEFDNVTGSILKFKAVTGTMDAGTPYLVKPAANVVNPVFTGVTVKEVESTTVSIANSESPGVNFQFKGTYNKVTLATDKTEQFLNTSGTFSYPSDTEHATMKGLRAYFIIPASVINNSDGAPELSISLDGGEEDVADGNTTVIDGIEYKNVKDGEYYNLAGQRVAQPSKGLYIVNGKKYIVK